MFKNFGAQKIVYKHFKTVNSLSSFIWLFLCLSPFTIHNETMHKMAEMPKDKRTSIILLARPDTWPAA